MRLIAFGDSFTYGHGLKDCYEAGTGAPGPIASRFAYPQILGNLTNRKTFNYSYPGQSNKQMAKKAVDFEFQEDDWVIFMWTFFDRHCVFENSTSPTKEISAWQADDQLLTQENIDVSDEEVRLAKSYYTDFYSDYDSALTNLMYINGTHHVVNAQVDRVIHLCVPDAVNLLNTDNVESHSSLQWTEHSKYFKWNEVKPFDHFKTYHMYERAQDNWHPGATAHKKFAEYLHILLG